MKFQRSISSSSSESVRRLILEGFLLDLPFDPEDRGDYIYIHPPKRGDFFRITRRYNAEDSTLDSHSCKNPISSTRMNRGGKLCQEPDITQLNYIKADHSGPTV
jgi:hypothetical protein